MIKYTSHFKFGIKCLNIDEDFKEKRYINGHHHHNEHKNVKMFNAVLQHAAPDNNYIKTRVPWYINICAVHIYIFECTCCPA